MNSPVCVCDCTWIELRGEAAEAPRPASRPASRSRALAVRLLILAGALLWTASSATTSPQTARLASDRWTNAQIRVHHVPDN
jgi:hypothetical protein